MSASLSSNDDDEDERTEKKVAGDPLRAATGIRPSLHPLTINAIATVLRTRARNDPDWPLEASREGRRVEPIQVALTAGRIAADAIGQRQASCAKNDKVERGEMTLRPEEEQTVAGRVVGVAMRLQELEIELYDACAAAPWIAKYGEWASFGILPDETGDDDDDDAVKRRILDDPLFAMNRAECLLALYLRTVEEPELRAKDVTVPGGSQVDFLDSERSEVLKASSPDG